MLEISVGSRAGRRERAVCKLGVPTIVNPAAVNLLMPNEKIELSFKQDELPPAHQLRMDVVFERFPRHEQEPQDGVEVGDLLKTGFFVEQQTDETQPAIEIDARFAFDDHPLVSFEVLVHPDRLVAGIENSDRVSFLQRDTAKLKSEHKDRLRILEQQKKALGRDEAELQLGLRAVGNELRRTALQNLDRLEQQQLTLQTALAALRTALDANAAEARQIQLEEEWRTRVTKLLSSLKTEGKVGVRLSIEIDGQRVVIVAPMAE